MHLVVVAEVGARVGVLEAKLGIPGPGPRLAASKLEHPVVPGVGALVRPEAAHFLLARQRRRMEVRVEPAAGLDVLETDLHRLGGPNQSMGPA